MNKLNLVKFINNNNKNTLLFLPQWVLYVQSNQCYHFLYKLVSQIFLHHFVDTIWYQFSIMISFITSITSIVVIM